MAVPPPLPHAIAADPAKPALRVALRAARAAHVAALGEAGGRAAAEAAAALVLPHIPARAVVALYLALPGELDPTPLADALHARRQSLALPVVAGDGSMMFAAWAPGDALDDGPLRLRQPAAPRWSMRPT